MGRYVVRSDPRTLFIILPPHMALQLYYTFSWLFKVYKFFSPSPPPSKPVGGRHILTRYHCTYTEISPWLINYSTITLIIWAPSLNQERWLYLSILMDTNFWLVYTTLAKVDTPTAHARVDVHCHEATESLIVLICCLSFLFISHCVKLYNLRSALKPLWPPYPCSFSRWAVYVVETDI